MPKVLELDCLSECDTDDKVITMLDEMLGKNATPKLRAETLYAYMGVRQSFYCGKPLSDEDECALAIEQLVLKNTQKNN